MSLFWLTDRMNLVIRHPNGYQCRFSHARGEAASQTLRTREHLEVAKRKFQNVLSRQRVICRQLERHGETPRQASSSRGETEEVDLQPPAMAGGHGSETVEVLAPRRFGEAPIWVRRSIAEGASSESDSSEELQENLEEAYALPARNTQKKSRLVRVGAPPKGNPQGV